MGVDLDTAATFRPKPKDVCCRMQKNIARCGGNPGRSGHKKAIDAARLVLFGVLRPGAHVITSSMEHNSVLRPINVLKEKVEVTILETGRDGISEPEKIRGAVTANTKLISVKGLTNFDSDSQNRITFIPTGQPELRTLLGSSHHLSPRNLEETASYIDHGLEVAHRKEKLFSDAAKTEIFKRTNGIAGQTGKYRLLKPRKLEPHYHFPGLPVDFYRFTGAVPFREGFPRRHL